MSGEGQISIGQTLREAREAQGMTLEDAAARLRLMHRQIEAMETGDFDGLGQPVFARGFVRNYARLLGLAPDALLARMEGGPAEPAAVSRAEPPLSRSWLSSPWLILLLLGVLVVVMAPVALYLWLNSEGGEDAHRVQPAAQIQRAPAPAPAAVAKPAEAPAVTPVEAAAETAAETPPAAEPAPVQLPGSALKNAEMPPEASPAAAPPMKGALHIEFGEESWVEIKDATGRMLVRKLHLPGSSADVQGQPPFDVVIGNAAQARLTYNGRPIDLKPFISVAVARFTLEE